MPNMTPFLASETKKDLVWVSTGRRHSLLPRPFPTGCRGMPRHIPHQHYGRWMVVRLACYQRECRVSDTAYLSRLWLHPLPHTSYIIQTIFISASDIIPYQIRQNKSPPNMSITNYGIGELRKKFYEMWQKDKWNRQDAIYEFSLREISSLTTEVPLPNIHGRSPLTRDVRNTRPNSLKWTAGTLGPYLCVYECLFMCVWGRRGSMASLNKTCSCKL